jgi:hypothetical protein
MTCNQVKYLSEFFHFFHDCFSWRGGAGLIQIAEDYDRLKLLKCAIVERAADHKYFMKSREILVK